MGDLSEELFKAGLISEEQYRRAKAARSGGRKEGRGGERRPRRPRGGGRPRGEDRREGSRRRAAEDEAAVAEPLAREGLGEVVRAEALRGTGGLRRWYFVARDGRVPFLEVSDEVARRLERGEVAIVEVPDQAREEFVIVPRRLAVRIQALAPDLVRCLAR